MMSVIATTIQNQATVDDYKQLWEGSIYQL